MYKIVFNKKEVFEVILVEDYVKEIKELNLVVDFLFIEWVLGVMWCVENDSFWFCIEFCDCFLIWRGVLLIIGFIYDFNGYIGFVIFKGK